MLASNRSDSLTVANVVPFQVGVTLGPRALEVAVRETGFDLVDVTAVMHRPRVIAVAVARVIELLPGACRKAFVRCLEACELLEPLPTRWLTGRQLHAHRHGADGSPGDNR